MKQKRHGRHLTPDSVDEEIFEPTRREHRAEAKRASAKDRSKYKKTDQDKRNKTFDIQALKEQGLIRGRVIAMASQGIVVYAEGKKLFCDVRGTLKKEKTQHKNLVAVGDFVWIEKLPDDEGSIAAVEPRKTILSRADNLSRRKEQLIATNIDQVLITVSVVIPPLKPPLIDRYIIATRKGGMEPVIVINKIDLLQSPDATEEDHLLFEKTLEAYKQAEVPVICVSADSEIGLKELEEQMRDKASVFSGQSGVGKTSLINAVTGTQLKIGEAVARTKKGAHTTTSAQLLPLACDGWCVDTPGIKSFGLWNLDLAEIESYFTEIHERGSNCKFSDCSHTHEKACAVLEAIEEGEISQLRYDSYQHLITTIQDTHKRR